MYAGVCEQSFPPSAYICVSFFPRSKFIYFISISEELGIWGYVN